MQAMAAPAGWLSCAVVLATLATSSAVDGSLQRPVVFRDPVWPKGAAEGAPGLPEGLLSATTAVLRAVATVPADTIQNRSQLAHFQSAQTAAAALVADNTLGWLLANPSVSDLVRQLLSDDGAVVGRARQRSRSSGGARNGTRTLAALPEEDLLSKVRLQVGARAPLNVGASSLDVARRRSMRNGTRASPGSRANTVSIPAPQAYGAPQRRVLQANGDGVALLAAFAREPAALPWNVTGWTPGTEPCGEFGRQVGAHWEGVSCEGGRVVEVSLQDSTQQFELHGSALRQLTELRALIVAGCVRGTIPVELGELSELQVLGLWSNPSLSGTIPVELGGLLNLEDLWLNSNPSLSGTIPVQLGELSELQVLSLWSNPSLSGTIPVELGGLLNLEDLHLHSNRLLSGTIPVELGELSKLHELLLYSNHLIEGTVPALSGCPGLRVLDISNTLLSGTISAEIGELSDLSYLLGGSLFLSGTIPVQLGELSELLELSLASNPSLSGTIPVELGELLKLQELRLDSSSSLSGTIPVELGELSKLQELHLYTSPSLSGTIPVELGGLSELKKLHLNSNPSLSGTISVQLGELLKLQDLWLNSNPSLSGTIPAGLGELSELHRLYLYSNPLLSGTIPVELGELSKLHELLLYSNQLIEGTVPALSGCPGLRVLDMHNCSLTRLPRSLPASLTHLYLDRNPLYSQSSKLRSLLRALGKLHVVDIGFINSKIVLEPDGHLNGTRVTKPNSCRVGEPCAFVLHMYDEYDQPAKQGGLIHNLTLRSGALSTPMHDNRDGTFTAAIPPDWVFEGDNSEERVFVFAHNGSEFRPRFVDRTSSVNVPDCHYDYNEHQERIPQGECASLRTVKFLPRQCTQTQYDSRKFGILVCTTGDWKPAGTLTGAYAETVERINNGEFCIECPSECTACNDSVYAREGWRPSIRNAAEISKLHYPADSLTPLFVFRCPSCTYGENCSCPQLLLDPAAAATSHAEWCSANHSGRLCETCGSGYSRRSLACVECEDDAIKQHFAFAVVVAVGGVAVLALLAKMKETIVRLKAPVWSLLKIVLGLAQVLGLLKDSLSIIYPPGPTHGLMRYLQLFTGDLKTLIQFDCRGWDWFDVWLLNVLGIPSLAVLLCCARYGWQRWRRNLDAQPNLARSLFFVILLLYPRVSAGILSALRCRQLGDEVSVLDMDYDVSCSDQRYTHYYLCAWLLLIAWPIGIPLGLLTALWRHYAYNKLEFEAMHDELLRSDATIRQSYGAAEHNRSKLIERYGFCLDSYRPGCWYFEPLDMLRKLTLSGLLQFVQRGTAAQVLLGCLLAFCAFGVQVRLLPYRDADANLLKACAELLTFLVFLISLILRVMPRIQIYEPIGPQGYGNVLVCTAGAFFVLAIGLVTRRFFLSHRFQTGLEDFASSAFTGGDGLELGVLARGHQSDLHVDDGGRRGDATASGSITGVEYTPLVHVEPEPEPEPHPEGQHNDDIAPQRQTSKTALLLASI